MNQKSMTVTFACLLRELGAKRTGAGGQNADFIKNLFSAREEIQEAVKYNTESQLRACRLAADRAAYLCCIAEQSFFEDHQARKSDRVHSLRSIFAHMNGEHPNLWVQPMAFDGMLHFPQQSPQQNSEYSLSDGLKEDLQQIRLEEKWIPALLAALEKWTGSIAYAADSDISVFDHIKMTAAMAGCLCEYLHEQNVSDYRSLLFDAKKKIFGQPAFFLYSADFSGIQNFIYTVSTDKALRALRGRSFFLELMMEHYIDEILLQCGMSRTNLLYSGGGHCYILLPNTSKTQVGVEKVNTAMNEWLLSEFGTSLYLADGGTACSVNELNNVPKEKSPYRQVFRRVSEAISKKKLHRYNAKQIIRLNESEGNRPSDRECRVCGRSDVRRGEEMCHWCKLFVDISPYLQEKWSDTMYFVSDNPTEPCLFKLPTAGGFAYYRATDEQDVRRRLSQGEVPRRIYSQNRQCMDLPYCVNLWVGNYSADNNTDVLSASSKGIRRMAVCRMDVDNLGQAFVAGYRQPDSKQNAERFVNIVRTSGFSRQMSLFFKCYINGILSGDFENCAPLNVSIVYSGGDDVFLLGAWNDIIEASQRIRSAFRKFTGGTLTLSAGVHLFVPHYPVRQAAQDTARLEEEAKSLPGKDAISLFEDETHNVYHWERFNDEIMDVKVKTLEDFFRHDDTAQGMAFLYRLLDFLRSANERINLARYAYLLARLEPKSDSAAYPIYTEFSRKMSRWAISEQDRNELITAIYIYVYLNRTEDGEER